MRPVATPAVGGGRDRRRRGRVGRLRVEPPGTLAPDLVTGWTLIGCGLAGWSVRPGSRSGALMAATGFTWFAGNFASVDVPPIAWLATQALYLHRGPLIHCVLSYPTGRLPSGLDRGGGGDRVRRRRPSRRSPAMGIATAILGALLVAVAARELRQRSIGPARRARLLALRASGGGRRDRARRERPGPTGVPRQLPPTRVRFSPTRRCCARSPWVS